MTEISNAAFAKCADLIRQAKGILVTAGAGMGVDAGLPDFRGTHGFWRAYPALADSKIAFEDIASPKTFTDDPGLAWGFYGHRLNLYRNTEPHAGYRMLLNWGKSLPKGSFVFTSNVDGLFQKTGFDDATVVECHGSIHWLQCLDPCSERIWSAEEVMPVVDESACRLVSSLPNCPECNSIARPNVLMFWDAEWINTRTQMRRVLLNKWLTETESVVVIELGAGSRIPSVREFGKNVCRKYGHPMIRINPTEPDLGGLSGVSMPIGALAALIGINDRLNAM